MKKRVLFLDRDGTIIAEPYGTEQVDRLDKLAFLPGALEGLSRIARETDFELVMVTNQDGLGTASFPEEDFWPPQNKMLEDLRAVGVDFSEILIDRSFAHQNAPTRKPGIGLLGRYLTSEYDLSASFVAGDRITDIRLAHRLGARGIWVSEKNIPLDTDLKDVMVLKTRDWKQIADYLILQTRTKGGGSRP
ncbi:MAG: histidinol-phosphatase [Candidatus Omnitrophica bacterium]|nr:histidinol-phosphatase [Candidatus Omnitrophota bacterium]